MADNDMSIRERRRLSDHDRYMVQRESRLKKRYEQYHYGIDKSREYYRNYRKNRIKIELEKLGNEHHFQQNNN